MKHLANLPRRARWAAPVGAAAVVGGVLAGSLVSQAQAAPALPSRTPAQLLAAVAASKPVPLTGTVTETSSLGLPQLPGADNPSSVSSMLTGSHTVNVTYAGPGHFRLAMPGSMSESDVVRDGSSMWLWQSTKNTATHVTLPARAAGQRPPQASAPTALTPQQAARDVLAKVGPTTTVRVDSNITVAGRSAYQLVLAPKSTQSLIREVRIAVDGKRDVPLRVQVLARNASSPAFSAGFRSVSFTPPAAPSFTPPAGAKVVQQNMAGRGAGRDAGASGGARTIGKGWLAVADVPRADVPNISGGTAQGSQAFAGENGAVTNALLKAAKPVRGSWGSGRLLRTSLMSVLLTSNGHVLAGAVEPSVLYQAAGQAATAPAGTGRAVGGAPSR